MSRSSGVDVCSLGSEQKLNQAVGIEQPTGAEEVVSTPESRRIAYTISTDGVVPRGSENGSGGHFSSQQHLDAECERLLRNAKRQVKQLMEEAVTKKFIHEESSSIIALCVAIEACLSYQLKRRALGLFKTNSSTALVRKIAKTCSEAKEIVSLVDAEEWRRQDEFKRQQQQKSVMSATSGQPIALGTKQGPVAAFQASFGAVCKRNMWIKYALIENKLIAIVEYLASKANKYYERDALMANCLGAQLLSSLLAGASALEFSRSKTNDYYQFEEPNADELLRRHKLSNPIACLCGRGMVLPPTRSFSKPNEGASVRRTLDYRKEPFCRSQREVSKSLSTSSGGESFACNGKWLADDENSRTKAIGGKRSRLRATATSHSSLREFRIRVANEGLQDSSAGNGRARRDSVSNISNNQRRRPLALRTNAVTGALVTECHHYSCQEISEHLRTRGYSFKSASNTSKTNRTVAASIKSDSSFGSAECGGTNRQEPGVSSIKSACRGGLIKPDAASQQHDTSVWSPRMLHETLHQNSKACLLYAKNNILLETLGHGLIPGYLSLHQTNSLDLILKWIPNQLINGGNQITSVSFPVTGGCLAVETETRRAVTEEDKELQRDDQATKGSKAANENQRRRMTMNGVSSLFSNQRSTTAVRSRSLCEQGENTACMLSKLDWSASSTAVCKRSQIIEWTEDEDDVSPSLRSNAIGSSYLDLVVSLSISRIVLLHCHFKGGATLCEQTPPSPLATDFLLRQNPLSSNSHKSEPSELEETLILVEADGVQRAPFKFPKGGLRWFLSCLETGLAPLGKILEPAMRPDVASENAPDPLRQLHSVDPEASGLESNQSNSQTLSASSEPVGSSRLEALLSRLPSLRRAVPARIQTNTVASSATSQSDRVASLPNSLQARSCNYVYRIVSTQQASLSLQTPPLSALSIDSVSSNGSVIVARNGTLQLAGGDLSTNGVGNGQRFRWSLRRLARFSARNNDSTTSSSSLGGSCTNGALTGSISTHESGQPFHKSTIQSSLSSLTSFVFSTNSSNPVDGNNNTRSTTINSVDSFADSIDKDASKSLPLKHDFSSDFMRIEAKLNDLKKSSSDELVALRDQSIQTLCDSMRKQLLARAFYGWLAYCRRLKIIRTHLIGLVNETSICAGEEDDVTDPERTSGLTWNDWRDLMRLASNVGQERQLDAIKKMEERVIKLVYFGGIEDNQLRAQVWPYLLGYYKFGDSFEMRQQRDESSREAYESNARDWSKIERVIRERDSEILAANMAKVARRQKRQERSLKAAAASTNGLLDQVAHSFSSFASETNAVSTSTDQEGEEEEEVDEEEMFKNSLSEKDEINHELELNSEPGLERLSELHSSEDRKDSCNKNDQRDNQDLLVRQRVDSGPVNASKARARARQSKRRRRRFRLESTGSVGSDASITDHFGNNIHRIDKDVQRCDRNFWYFKETENLNKLRNLMFSYVWRHLDVGYVQGMCDLAAPLLVIFDKDELMAYNCFSQLMKRMVANFPHGSAMDEHFKHLKYLMQVLDPKLFEIFQNNGDYTHFYFCYRWLLLDFKRELVYEDVYRVWETIWSASFTVTKHFVVFMALAMVKYYRDIIIENNMDFTDTIKFFNEMAERHDVERIIALAQECIVELQSLART